MQSHAEATQEPVVDSVEQEIGLLLSQARREKKLTLDDVAASIHVRKLYLAAIEQGQLDVLPGRIYAYGFIRKYAEFLELDSGEFQRRLTLVNNDQLVLMVPELFAMPEKGRQRKWLIISGFLAVLSLGGIYLWQKKEAPSMPVSIVQEAPQPQTVNPVAETAADTVQPQSSEEVAVEVEEPAVVPAMVKAPIITLRANQPTWIDVRQSNGSPIMTRILQAGERYILPENMDVKINVGNAGGVDVLKDDVLQKPLGKIGQVRKDLTRQDLAG